MKTLASLYGFILLISVIGCSDMPYTPYTGSMLTPADVDRYITTSESRELCLVNNADFVCLEQTQGKNKTRIHIYPKRIVYTFYHDRVVLLQAEKQTGIDETSNTPPDSQETINGETPDPTNEVSDEAQNGNGSDGTVNNEGVQTSDAFKGWVVWVYYQSGIPAEATPSLEGSGFTITVLDDNGTDITDSVTNVSLVRGDNGDALKFFVLAVAQQITVRVHGILSTEHVAIFIVDASGTE